MYLIKKNKEKSYLSDWRIAAIFFAGPKGCNRVRYSLYNIHLLRFVPHDTLNILSRINKHNHINRLKITLIKKKKKKSYLRLNDQRPSSSHKDWWIAAIFFAYHHRCNDAFYSLYSYSPPYDLYLMIP
jgi:CRISPR/Cas system-associated endoribonuclease Cas2